MRRSIRAYLWCLLAAFSPLFAEEPELPVVEQCNPRIYHIRSVIKPVMLGSRPDDLFILTALPQSSQYQSVSGETFSQGEIRNFPMDCGRYIFYAAKRRSSPLVREFKVTIYELHTHWDRIKKIPPPSSEMQYFTKNCGDTIDRDHPDVVKTARKLAERSSNPVEYARAAYLFVTANFKYGQCANRRLRTIWKRRHGDCGDLSAVFISLMRARNIPARSVFAVRPDNTYHVWAEFYLDGVGWIPVDVTADLGRGGEFRHFGNYDDNCVVMHRDRGFRVHNGRKEIDLDFLQTYSFWCYSRHRYGKVKVKMTFAGERLPAPPPRRPERADRPENRGLKVE